MNLLLIYVFIEIVKRETFFERNKNFFCVLFWFLIGINIFIRTRITNYKVYYRHLIIYSAFFFELFILAMFFAKVGIKFPKTA